MLSGKRVFITAAGQGIGRTSTQAFLAAGAEVIATDLDPDLIAALPDHERLTKYKVDVMDKQALADGLERAGRIDVLFNLAGCVHTGTVLDMSEEELDFAWQLNVIPQVRACKAVLPQMIERKDGCIINMSSVVSSVKAVPNRAAYGITKSAVIGLTKVIAADYVADNIRCNAIAPGTVDTPSLKGRISDMGDYDEMRKVFEARQPMGRIAQPQEVADLAVYLAGATFTTGQVYTIDGGWTG